MKINTDKILNEIVLDSPNYHEEVQKYADLTSELSILKRELKKLNTEYDEEALAEEHEDDFNYIIRERGMDYYYDNHVAFVNKANNNYTAKVKGSSNNNYEVNITVHGEDIEYSCTCPCNFNCKHEYATLLAISNLEYVEIDLKPFIREKSISLRDLVNLIPEAELKEYVLSRTRKDYIDIDENSIRERFNSYMPLQEYDYYYNNLYNALVLDSNHYVLSSDYLDKSKKYIADGKYNQVFLIIKAIIDAFNAAGKLDSYDYIIDLFPKIGMYLRIANRKADSQTKIAIINWLNEVKKLNYYDNLYLEDIILSINYESGNYYV